MLTPEQKEKLKQAGYNNAKIAAYEMSKFGSPDESRSFVTGVKSALNERSQNAKGIASSNQRGGSKVLQSLGNAAGFVGDLGMEAVKAVTPNAVEDVVSGGIRKVAQTKPAQDVLGKYNEWAQAHPEASKNLQAVVNIASIIPAFKGAQLGGKAVAKGAQKTATAVSTATKGITKGVRNTVGATVNPENIMQRVARIPKGAQARFENTAKESVGKYLNKRQIYGNTEDISKQLYDRFSGSREAADQALATLPGKFKPTPVKTALDELIGRETRVSSPGALSPDFQKTRELLNKFDRDGLTMSEINEVKRLYERNVRLDFVKQNLPEKVARSTNIDNALRQWQFTQAEKLGLKNLPDINRETRLAKQLLDDLGKEVAGSAGNNAIPLSDIILLASGDPAVISGFFLKKGIGTKGIQSAIAKKLYKGEKVGTPEAKFGASKPGLEEFMNKPAPKLNTQGGFIKGADGGNVKRIHPEDKRVMKDFTDYVAKEMGRMTPKEIHELELAASRIAERYNIKGFKSLKGLSNEFGRILDDQGLNFGKIAGNPLVAGAGISAAAAALVKLLKDK